MNSNDIIAGISIALNGAFGSGYQIYQDDVTQGMAEPCFLITTLEMSVQPLQKDRYLMSCPFDIIFFPSSSTDNGTMLSVAGQMFPALEFITLVNGDKLHGTSMRHTIQDGALHFFVDYNHTTRREENTDYMQTLDYTGGIAHG